MSAGVKEPLLTSVVASLGIPAWAGPYVAVGALLVAAAGIYGGVVLHGREIQAQKDTPVVKAAQEQTAVAQGGVQLGGKQQDNTAALTAVLSALAKKNENAIQSVQAAPSGDAAWDAYLAGLRRDHADAEPLGPVPGGSPAEGAPSWPNPTHESDPA